MLDQEVLDRLRPWLLASLQNTELDAKDMADYVVSLISAPGSREQLFQQTSAELSEFLGSEASAFVASLFAEIDRLTGVAPAAPVQQQQPQGAPDAVSQPQASQHHDQNAPSADAPSQLNGGQEEFRRNFRSDSGQGFSFPKPTGSFEMGLPAATSTPPPQFAAQGQGFPAGFPQGMPPAFFQQMQQQGGMPPGFPGAFGPQGGFGQFKPGPRQKQWRNNARQHNRSGPASQLSSIRNDLSAANRRIVVEGIPDDKLNEESVREYFSKFGTLTSVRVDEGAKLAELEFSGHDEAKAAHGSPDPIFDNRFVKVFWRRLQPNEAPPELDIESVRRMQAIKQEQFKEKESRRRDLTARIKQTLEEQTLVLRQRQELLQSGSSSPEQMAEGQRRTEELSAQLGQLKQELAQLSGSASAGPGGRPGGPFKPRSGPYGGGPARGGAARRGGGYRGGYRGSYHGGFGAATLDRRPRGVLVEGVSEANDEQLRGRLAASNYTDYQRQSGDSVLIAFGDRKAAEEFFNTPHEIPDVGQVKKKWVQVEDRPDSDANASFASNESSQSAMEA